MKEYKRITVFEREEISIRIEQKVSIRTIAKHLGRSSSTISRELSRHHEKGVYRAIIAQEKVRKKLKASKRSKLEKNPELFNFVYKRMIENKWTPEQVAKRLKILYPKDMNMRISHETIYRYVYVKAKSTLKKELVGSLRRKHKNRKSRKTRHKSCPIQDYVSIEQRPQEVQDRLIPGHWEGDLIMGKDNKSAIGTLVERTARLTIISKLKEKNAEAVRKAFAKEFEKVPEGLKKSLTYDQGQEMAQHKIFTKETKIQVYFAHPHSPWERGTSENTNALIRQFFPKGTDFNKVTEKELKRVQELLNDRPRKVHDFYTPNEVFNKVLQ
jgi:IS30 family transposase